MEKIKDKCMVCNGKIDEYAFYVTDSKKYFCSEECVEKVVDEEEFDENIWDIQFCPAYDYCDQLNNIRKMCKFKNNITPEKSVWENITTNYPNWCSPSESSQIISNVKLYNFVKKSEKISDKLNKESFKQNKTTKNLTWIMTGVSIVNLILILVQIYLQFN